MDPNSSTLKEVRNWLELPSDVMCLIFIKVGTVDILSRVQLVCSTWRKLAKEPHLFRSIDIYSNSITEAIYYKKYLSNEDNKSTSKERDMMMELAKEAVNRSCGQLVDFSIHTFATDELLELIIAKNSPLKRLKFASCLYISDNAVIDMAKKLPLLEELEICNCDFEFPEEVVKTFGQSCRLLKSFTLNYCEYMEALAIAQSMPELRHLVLSGAYLTDNELQAILDSCPHLNFLDLSRCSNLNFAWGLVKMCLDRNIKLRLLDVASNCKFLIQMNLMLLSLLKECILITKTTYKAEFGAGYMVEEFEAFCDAVEDLEATGYGAVEDLDVGYTTILATSDFNEVLNELTQMQSILSVLQENVLLIQRAVKGEQDLQVSMAQLHDSTSRTLLIVATICSYIPCLRSRYNSKP